MKRILLVHLPFCTPAGPPYSITHLYSFLKNNCNEQICVLDLNLEFHKLKFPEYQRYFQNAKNWDDYDKVSSEYNRLTEKTYSENNKKVVNGEKPEFFLESLNKIKNAKPDIAAFSIVYSSQAFYAYALIKELKGIACVVGGPAVNKKLVSIAKALNNEVELLEYILGGCAGKLNTGVVLDFSIYNLDEYFTPKPVLPIKTTSTCYYKRCTFCTHFSKNPYYEFSLEDIKQTIIKSKQKYFYLIDDLIPARRLLEIAEALKQLNVVWTCQLRPIKELDYETLKRLNESGLALVMWGVESGNQRVLDLMGKGTNKEGIKKVLEDSHNAGIKNMAYIIFGFPTETKEEFLETIEFLKKNEKNIDLVATSIFGLQKGSFIYNNPEMFGITNIIEEKRTILEPKITYEVKNGLTQEEAGALRARHKKTIRSINKYPKAMKFFREHLFF